MINIIGPASIPAHDTPFITACRNYANGCPCGLFTGGRTRCIPATNVMSGGNVSDCTGTSTSSFTATKYPSHSVSLTFISSTETPQPTASRRTTRSDTLLPSASASPLSSSASLTRTTSSSTSQSNTIASASRTSSPSFFINTSTRSQSSTATLSGTLSHRSPSITYTSTFTAAPPPTNTPCNYSCADVIALRQVSPSISTPQQAIDAYVPSRTTAPPQGCTALILPFTLTTKGAVTRVLIHINAPSTGLNTSHSLVGALLPTSQPAMQATVTASNYTQGGIVLVVDVRRVDDNPTTAISSTATIPSDPFVCVPTTNLPHNGLPWANIDLGAPPPSLGDAERAVVAIVAVTTADLQTVAAIGLLRCSPGSDNDVESEAGIRALVPVALSGTCAGAVQGALLAISVAGILSVVAMCIAKAVKGLRWVEAAAMTRCPGIVIAVWAFMQMGLVVCGARLITDDGGANVVLGVLGVVFGAALPAVCMGLAFGVVSRRCYRLAQVPEAVAGRHAFVIWMRSVFLPTYELDTNAYPVSRAFSTVVSRTRRPSCAWAGLPVIQPVIMMMVSFVKGTSCNMLLIVAGVVMMLVGALCHVLFRPHRIVAANYLQGVAMALNAAVLFIASKLVGDPLDVAALNANAAIAMIQVALSVCRFAHTLSYLGYMRFYGATVLAVVDKDTTPTTTLPTTSITPVFHIQCALCTAATVGPIAIVEDDTQAPLLIQHDDNRGRGFQPTNNDSTSSSSHSSSPIMSTSSSVCHVVQSPMIPSAKSEKGSQSTEIDEETPLQTKKKHPKQQDKLTKKFIWNPKEYVPMERPYTMLYEEDFTPPSEDGEDADIHLEMDSIDIEKKEREEEDVEL